MNAKVVSFKQLIQKYSGKLPIVFEVQDGCYGNALGGPRDFSSGEIYRVESVDHEVNVTFSDVYSVSSNRGLITLPLNFNGCFSLITVGQDKHSTKPSKTLKSIISNPGLPCTVYPTQDLPVSDLTIPKGTEVKVIKCVKFKATGSTYLYSEYFSSTGKKNVLIGVDTVGRFNYDKQYTLGELLQKMPVKVLQITTGAKDQQIPGLPENFTDPLFLSEIDVVNCRPVVDTSEVIRIPIDTDFTVKKINLSDDHFNPSINIHSLLNGESSFPLCVEVVDFDDVLKISGGMKNLQLEQLLIVEASDEIEKVLIGGKERYFSIPKEMYKGRFKRVPRIFQTADDLWQDRYTKKVRVTQDYIVSSSQLDSIFAGDILTATDCKVASLPDGECEILICSRESSVLGSGRPRVLRIPSYAIGNFEEVEFPLETFTLSRMPSELPFRARLQATPQQRKHNKDDAILRDEAPLTFKLCFNEINILVSVFDESKNITTHQFIIPEHVSVKVKRRIMPLGYKPKGSPSYENRLMIDLLSETEYNLLYTNNQTYVEPTAKAPAIPPRPGAKPKQQRTCRSQGSWSDSDDDDYDKPSDINDAKKSATLNSAGTYVIPDIKRKAKLPALLSKNLTLRKLIPKRHRSKESSSNLSVYETKYETIESGNADNDFYLQPMEARKHPGVEKLQQTLTDMEVNQEALEKLRELCITQEELVHQLNVCSDNDLMIRLKFKKLEILGLRGLMT